MTAPRVPAGWPAGVWPPGEPGWEQTAQAWLLDQAPPEWRLVPVLRRHPSVLAWMAVHHLAAQLQAARAAWSDFTGSGDGQVAQEVCGMLTQVGPELASRLRSAEYLLAALEDTRYAT